MNRITGLVRPKIFNGIVTVKNRDMPKEITKVCLLVKSQSILFCRSVKQMYSKAAKPKKNSK